MGGSVAYVAGLSSIVGDLNLLRTDRADISPATSTCQSSLSFGA